MTLGVSERTLRRWIREGRIASYKVGGRVRIPERAVREAAVPYDGSTGVDLTPTPEAGAALRAERLVGALHDPAGRADAARRRREAAAARMDEIAARCLPSSGPEDTVDAYLGEDRAERDRHWDEVLGLDRP